MTKLIIQIPCLNEEDNIAASLQAIPRTIPGIDIVEIMIIDDGSTDRTVEVALENGADHIISHTTNQGLAKAFMTGIEGAIDRQADIIVNTDADNQYNADDIPKLVEPILQHRAEMVIGARPILDIEHFSIIKKILQRTGSWVVRTVSGASVDDAPSGFRAMSRNAAMRLNVFSTYTYTLETLIQAGNANISVVSVPIRVNGETRPSRLVRSIASYVLQSVTTIMRILLIYRAFSFLMTVGTLIALPGIFLGLRFTYFFMQGNGDGHIQSLILAALLMILGGATIVSGILADLLSVNRRILEGLRIRTFNIESTLRTMSDPEKNISSKRDK